MVAAKAAAETRAGEIEEGAATDNAGWINCGDGGSDGADGAGCMGTVSNAIGCGVASTDPSGARGGETPEATAERGGVAEADVAIGVLGAAGEGN